MTTSDTDSVYTARYQREAVVADKECALYWKVQLVFAG